MTSEVKTTQLPPVPVDVKIVRALLAEYEGKPDVQMYLALVSQVEAYNKTLPAPEGEEGEEE